MVSESLERTIKANLCLEGKEDAAFALFYRLLATNNSCLNVKKKGIWNRAVFEEDKLSHYSEEVYWFDFERREAGVEDLMGA